MRNSLLSIIILIASCSDTHRNTEYVSVESKLNIVCDNWTDYKTIYVVNDLDCSDCVAQIQKEVDGSSIQSTLCLYYLSDTTGVRSQNFGLVKSTNVSVSIFSNISLIEALADLPGGLSGPYVIQLEDGQIFDIEHVTYLK